MQATIEASPPLGVAQPLLWTQKLWGSLLVILLHGSNLILWFFLMLRADYRLHSMGGFPPRPIALLFDLGHYIQDYFFVSLPVLVGLAALHLWAICQSRVKYRIASWLVLALGVLFLLGIFFEAIQPYYMLEIGGTRLGHR